MKHSFSFLKQWCKAKEKIDGLQSILDFIMWFRKFEGMISLTVISHLTTLNLICAIYSVIL